MFHIVVTLLSFVVQFSSYINHLYSHFCIRFMTVAICSFKGAISLVCYVSVSFFTIFSPSHSLPLCLTLSTSLSHFLFHTLSSILPSFLDFFINIYMAGSWTLDSTCWYDGMILSYLKRPNFTGFTGLYICWA
jgi:hypothetical protein